MAAYRDANLARDAAAPAARPQDPRPDAAPPQPGRRVSWLDPGGTGAGLPEASDGTPATEVASVEDATPEPEPPPADPPAPAEVPELPAAPAAVGGPAYVEIAALELCRSVGGFGVYEPFEDATFTAGAPVRMVLYAEIEGYATDTTPVEHQAEGDGGTMHRVRLSQEVLLFRDADGLVVWSREPEQIQDESRRRRRDFWSVQLVELPANLGVGRYRLKVRITDEVSGSIDERSVALRLVAESR